MSDLKPLVDADASHVNRKAFTDQLVFEQEARSVFARTWQFVAHESEVKAAGDYVTRKLGIDPVIVVRADSGEINVLHNSCRHRGAQMTGADKGNAKHFRCSYHGWTYSNSGALRGVPSMPELYSDDFKKSELGLVRAAQVEVFCGLVFATWDRAAPPIREALGSMAWYLETVFGKCEMEVVGPPVRTLGHQNWKSGAENWAGDVYHGGMAHKVVFDKKVVDDSDILMAYLEQLGIHATPDSSQERFASCQLTADRGGHAGWVERMGVRLDKLAFLGYEPHVWPEFISRLSAEQAEFASGRRNMLANIFPNLSFLEAIVTNQGDGLPPIMVLNLRVWVPVSATETEIVNWVVVPKAASPEWKRRAQIAFTRTLGPGGMLETDDFQNWTGIAQMNRGIIGQSIDNDYTGCADVQPSPEPWWPGNVYPALFTDVMFRALYQEWGRLMEHQTPRSVASHASPAEVPA